MGKLGVVGAYEKHFRSPQGIAKGSAFLQSPLLSLFIFVRTLVKPVRELNVYALSSVMLLAICKHHHFKKICLCLFVVDPDLTPAVANSSDLTASGHC